MTRLLTTVVGTLLVIGCTGAGIEAPMSSVDGSGQDIQVQDAPATNETDIADASDAGDTRSEVDTLEDISTELPSDDGGVADVADTSAGDVAADKGPDISLPPGTFLLSCTDNADCKTPCAVGSCVQGSCVFQTPQQGCIIVDQDSGLGSCVNFGALHPESDCLFCNPYAQVIGFTPFVFAEDFEATSNGLFVSNLSGSKATWTRSTQRSANGEASLYFGDPSSLTYEVGTQRAWARASSDSVLIPEGVTPKLSFQVWLDTERLKAHDFLRVLIMYGSGTEHEIWHSDSIGGTTEGEFLPVSADLSEFAGQQIKLVFEFDSVDGIINGYEGAYIDAVRLTTGCCGVPSDCDDGDGCTVDACPAVGALCVYETQETCCNNTSECDDGNACTSDSCSGPGGQCEYLKIPGCCFENLDCNDDDPCTEDRCDQAAETCSYVPLCCTEDNDCDDGDPCTTGTCDDDQCSYAFSCCIDDIECDDGDYCTADACVEGACSNVVVSLPGCCQPDIAGLDFEVTDQVEGWSFDAPDNGVGWQIANGLDAAPGNAVLYYGNPTTQNFDSDSTNSGSAVSAPFTLPEGYAIELSFAYQFEGETSNSYDQFDLFVVTAVDEVKIVSKSDISTGGWKTIVRDISWAGGATVQLRFSFNSVDSITNDGFGMIIDELALTSTCEAKPCSTNSQCPAPDFCTSGFCEDGSCTYANTCCSEDSACDDQEICTTDSCVGGQCSFKPIAGCCENAEDCDDGNVCTTDTCSTFGGQCANTVIAGCCLGDGDCDDGNACTADACNDTNTCSYTDICCDNDDECDDGDDVCTTDACVDNFCQFSPTGADGCCDGQPVDWDFESTVPFTYQGGSTCKWQIGAGTQSFSGAQTLFYADAAAGNFDCGDNSGIATSPEFTLSPNVSYALTFMLYMDTESSTSYDQLFIFVLDDGVATEIWDKSELNGTQTWQNQSADLTPWAGKTIRVEFRFDTTDSISNSGEGVFVDDVKVVSDCIPN